VADHDPIPVSPRHEVRLASEYAALVSCAPATDYVVRTIARQEANGMPLMTAEIVIAGRETRERYALAATYPLHFRKTYFPGRLHGDPGDEYARQAEAHELVDVPPPIGHTAREFRACLVPGSPYSRLSPFDPSAEESNVRKARELSLAVGAGLWRLIEHGMDLLDRLHAGGLSHGDTELHNFIVCPSPLEMVPIDFEGARRRDSMSDDGWTARCTADLDPLLREAIFLEAGLGPQRGALSERARDRMDALFSDPGRLRSEIGRQLSLR
jgi:hypothetical protein